MNSPYVKSVLARKALEFVPPLIRATLFEGPDFREKYGFTADPILTFRDFDTSVQRSTLYGAARKVLSEAFLKPPSGRFAGG